MVKHKSYVSWRHLATKFFFSFFNYFESGEPISVMKNFKFVRLVVYKWGILVKTSKDIEIQF